MTKKRQETVSVCSKEKEINEMKTHILETKGDIKVILTDIKYIKKALDGNGKKGLVENVEDNTKYIIQDKERYDQKQNSKKLWLGSGIGLVIVLIILNIFALMT